MNEDHPGLRELLRYPLFSAIFNRRSRRMSKSVKSISAGNLSYTSKQEPEPLDPLEEAVLILATGVTGTPLLDFPTRSADGDGLVGTPMLKAVGRASSSVDNAQATHFFLMNDTGTYFLKRPDDVEPSFGSQQDLDTEAIISYAEKCKVKVLDERVDYPRRFPYYLGPNRFVSNLPGTTVLVPVVDVTRQYINGLMFLLNEPDGHRPVFRDDWNLYRLAGVKKWVRNGFLNKDQIVPLSILGNFRTDVETSLLMQNLLLTIQAMGLGGWIHAAFHSPVLLGGEDYAADGSGLGFRFEKPKKCLRRLLRFLFPLTSWSPNPVGLDGVLEGLCPPYMTMSEAVDAVVDIKHKKGGIYEDPKHFDKVLKPGLAEPYLNELPHDSDEVVACVKDICNYIYDTYGRFPAHVDAIHVPGVWVQAHHLDLAYYDEFYQPGKGYSETQANHHKLWHRGQS